MRKKAEKINSKSGEKIKSLEEKAKYLCVVAILIAVCLAVACTYAVIPSCFLTIYGVILIISGIIIIYVSNKVQNEEETKGSNIDEKVKDE